MALSLQLFWKIVDSTSYSQSANRNRQVQDISKILKTLDLEDLGAFKRHLNRMLTKAYTFPLMVAAFTVHSYLADDLFLEFRAWLILHGRKTFEKTIKNPDIIATLVSKDKVRKINCSGFPELPTAIWLDRGGSLKFYVEKVGYLKNPAVKQNWPKDRKEFQQRYPVLYKAFWNPARIKALNSL